MVGGGECIDSESKLRQEVRLTETEKKKEKDLETPDMKDRHKKTEPEAAQSHGETE